MMKRRGFLATIGAGIIGTIALGFTRGATKPAESLAGKYLITDGSGNLRWATPTEVTARTITIQSGAMKVGESITIVKTHDDRWVIQGGPVDRLFAGNKGVNLFARHSVAFMAGK